MPKKSRWDSDFWKGVKALSAAIAIVVGTLGILQFFINVDVYNILLVPIFNFFNSPIPLYSVPLTAIIVTVVIFVVIVILTSTGGSSPVRAPDPLDGADVLDTTVMRYLALLCKTPKTTDFLSKKHQEFSERYRTSYTSKECLDNLDKAGLLAFDTVTKTWLITQKALDYIAKYHGD